MTKLLDNRLLFLIAASLFLTIVVFTFRQVNSASLIENINIRMLLVNVLLGLIYFVSFGLIMKTGFQQHYGISITPTETLTLPLMMHLFTYIFPIKGGLLFQIFYMKRQHQLELNKGFSFGITVFVIGAFTTVVLGLFLNYWLHINTGPLLYFLLSMAFGLTLLPLVLCITPITRKLNWAIANRLIRFLTDVRHQLREQLSHPKLLLQLWIASTVSVLIQAFWYQQSSAMLGYSTPFLSMLLIALVLRVILLLRLLPGNLGLQELMTGVVFTAAGFTVEEGLLVALATRLVSVFLASTIGLAGLYYIFRDLHLRSIKPIIASVSGRKLP